MASDETRGPARQDWPPLPLAEWQETRDTLHMWTQIVGKVKLQLCPFLNEWWQVALHPTARGLTTSVIPFPGGVFEIYFDFVAHQLLIQSSEGSSRVMALYPRSVADFYAEFMAVLRSLGIEVTINTIPDEVTDRIRFEEDQRHTSYDRELVNRWWRIVMQTCKVFEAFRSPFFGKSSPVHFWWGGFDLSHTRYSGQPAPAKAGMNRMMRLAEDQKNISFGFWTGSGKLAGPVFYSYTYPEPEGLKTAAIRPRSARYDGDMGEFILPYDEMRQAGSPDKALMEFLQSTYEVGATLGHWDRDRLERPVPELQRRTHR